MQLKTNDRVRITYCWQTVEGTVLLASDNGRSLMLGFPDHMLGGYIEKMPVLENGEGDMVDLAWGKPVTIVKVEPA